MIGALRSLLHRWTWVMAWRESRSRRARLALFASSMILGAAALIAIGSFRDAVLQSVEEQSKALLGADLVLSGRSRFGADEEALFQTLPGRQASEMDLSSMISFPAQKGTRLVQLRAMEGEFPFYGTFETEPADAVTLWRATGGFLIEETLLAHFGVKIGDSAKVGDLTAPVVGALKRVPGDSLAFATLAPRVYLRGSDLAKAGLLKQGSLARYKRYFELPAGTKAEEIVKQIRPRMDELRLGHTTAEKRKEDLGNSLENLASFLSLAGFVALFLGGVGVGSAIHSHVREKLPNAALLRCIGLGESRTFGIYLAQALALGLLASTLGAFLGLLAQWALPHFIGSLLPVRIPFAVGIKGVAEGFALALAFCMLFALLPLLAIRRMSPWAALRVSLGGMAVRRFPWAETLVVLALVGMSASFAIRHTDKWVHGLSYALGLFGAFAFLTFLASLCVRAARRFAPGWLPYPWRQGLANLHRPNNRTALLVLSLGLGTFVLVTLHLTQKVLIAQLIQEGPSDRPNTLLFDIQPDQREGVESLLAAQGVRVLDQSAIVTLRLESLRGKTIEQMLSDTNRQVAKWALRREYRCTWRSEPSPSEKVTSGEWHPPYNPDQDPIPVSLEEGIARDLGLRLGDNLSFDLQGVELKARVASLRKVEWRRVQPNFFVIFPPGSLEGAPAFHVFVTRTSSAVQSATLQRSVVEKFPNVSAIDLTLVLNTLNAIIDKAASAIRFMALFTVGTGLLVLAGAILSGRHQRMRESALLRTLGASRAQIRGILMAEYASLGLLSAGAGCALAVVASWALARHVFKTQFSTELAALAPPLIIVTMLTLVAGWLGSRSAAQEPPLESLRREST